MGNFGEPSQILAATNFWSADLNCAIEELSNDMSHDIPVNFLPLEVTTSAPSFSGAGTFFGHFLGHFLAAGGPGVGCERTGEISLTFNMADLVGNLFLLLLKR